MTQQEIMLTRQVQELQKKTELMRKMITVNGFFQAYFEALKDAKTNTDAFNKVNDEYFELFGEYKYTDWNSFRNSLDYHKKRNKLS